MSTMNDEEAKGFVEGMIITILAPMLILAALLAGSAIWGFVVWKLWHWIVLAIFHEAIPLTFWQCACLMTVVQCVRIKPVVNYEGLKTKTNWWMYYLLAPLLYLGYGKLISLLL